MANKATMNERERIEAILRREKPDRVPIWPFSAMGFATVYTGASIAEAYNKPKVALATQRKAAKDFGWVFAPVLGYAAFGGWEFGGEIKWPSGEFSQAPTVLKQPVETPEDVMSLKLPDIKNAGIVPLMIEFYKLATKERLDNEPFNVMSFADGCFTRAANICGVDNLCRWLLKRPEVAHRVLRLSTDFTVELAQYWKDTFGIDGVLPKGGDPTSSNAMISPRHFEQFALPYIKEAQERVLAMGYKTTYIHICGEQNLNLPYWAQVPMGDPGIVSVGHEVELETAAHYFPNDIIMGNLEPTIIQTGTPQEVYEATKEVVEKGKKIEGGFVFSPGCETPPMSSVKNIMAMTDAVNDAGWYI
ncbi:uroporphyrinogen decarboxylase family protein [Thermodesulfobacteriota bacterium]